jgi:hypothetical protein
LILLRVSIIASNFNLTLVIASETLSSASMVSPKISQTLVNPCLCVMIVGMGPFLPSTMAVSVCRKAVFE